MQETVCCVCDAPAGPGARQLGGRCYCAAHYERAVRDRRGLWQAGAAQIAVLLLLVAAVEIVLALTRVQVQGAALVLTGVVLALAPALLWLAFFYRQDRLEPEPKGYVAVVFVLGMLLAGAVALPLTRTVFRVGDWSGQSPLIGLLGSVLVVGFSHEFLKYAAVRYSVYPLAEFDERVDGILYGTASGLGFAAAINLDYVLQSGGVDLQVGVIQVVVTALAQASFAGLTGYFLGRSKFEDRPLWWLPAGLALSAVLNGVFTFLRGEVTRGGIHLGAGGGYTPWPGLWLATGVAVAVFVTLNLLIHRAGREAWKQATEGAQ